MDKDALPTWIGNGINTGCFGATTLACAGTSALPCGGGAARAFGTITINGSGVSCKKVFFDDGTWAYVCNSSAVSVNINGVTVSVGTSSGSTASALASALANQINSNPSLVGLVIANSAGNQVFVHGAQGSADPAMIALYPWATSCSYNFGNFTSCAFSASLTSVSTMGTRPPL